MGFNDLTNGSGYTQFGKGANLIARPDEIEADQNDQYGNYQLKIVFKATPENGGEPGRIPGWFNSKITIRDSDEHTSDLAKLLREADVLEEVLRELGANDEIVELVLSGEKNYEAEDEGDNLDLKAAVAKHVGKTVFRVGSKFGGEDNDYSKVNEVYERYNSDPFADDDAGADETETAAPQAS